MKAPKGFDTEDGKLDYCLACQNQLSGRLGKDVILCDHCPAAFHPQCAGYASLEEVPQGRWPCWNCSHNGQDFLFPNTKLEAKVGDRVMVGYADPGSKAFVIFYEAHVVKLTGTTVEVEYTKYKGANEVLSLRSPRIWHGTQDRRTWTSDPTATHWQPLARPERPYPEIKVAQEYWSWLQAQRAKDSKEQRAQRPGGAKGSGRASPPTQTAGSALQGPSSLSPRMKGAKQLQQTDEQGGNNEVEQGLRAGDGMKSVALPDSQPAEGQPPGSGDSGASGRGIAGGRRGGQGPGGNSRGRRSRSRSATPEPSQLLRAKQLKQAGAGASRAQSAGGAAPRPVRGGENRAAGAAKGDSPAAAPAAATPGGAEAGPSSKAASESPVAAGGAAKKRAAGGAAAMASPQLAGEGPGGKDGKDPKQVKPQGASGSPSAVDGFPGEGTAAAVPDDGELVPKPLGDQQQKGKEVAAAIAAGPNAVDEERKQGAGSGEAMAASKQVGQQAQGGQKRSREQEEGASSPAEAAVRMGRKRSKGEEGSAEPAPAREGPSSPAKPAAAGATAAARSAAALSVKEWEAEVGPWPEAVAGGTVAATGPQIAVQAGNSGAPQQAATAVETAATAAAASKQQPEQGQPTAVQQEPGAAAGSTNVDEAGSGALAAPAHGASSPRAGSQATGGSGKLVKKPLASLMPPIPPPAAEPEQPVPMLGRSGGGRGRGRGRGQQSKLARLCHGLGGVGEASKRPKLQGAAAAAGPSTARLAVGQALPTRLQAASTAPSGAAGWHASTKPAAGASAGVAVDEAAGSKVGGAKRVASYSAGAGAAYAAAPAPAATQRSTLQDGGQQEALAQQLREAASEALKLGEHKWRVVGFKAGTRALASVTELLRGVARGEMPANTVVKPPDLPPGSASDGQSARSVVGAWVGKLRKAQHLHTELGKLRQSLGQQPGQQRSESPAILAAPAGAAAGQDGASGKRRRLEGLRDRVGTRSFGTGSRQGTPALSSGGQPAATSAAFPVPLVQANAMLTTAASTTVALAAADAADAPTPSAGEPTAVYLAQPLGMAMYTYLAPVVMYQGPMQAVPAPAVTSAPHGPVTLPPNVQASWQALALAGTAASSPSPKSKGAQPAQATLAASQLQQQQPSARRQQPPSPQKQQAKAPAHPPAAPALATAASAPPAAAKNATAPGDLRKGGIESTATGAKETSALPAVAGAASSAGEEAVKAAEKPQQVLGAAAAGAAAPAPPPQAHAGRAQPASAVPAASEGGTVEEGEIVGGAALPAASLEPSSQPHGGDSALGASSAAAEAATAASAGPSTGTEGKAAAIAPEAGTSLAASPTQSAASAEAVAAVPKAGTAQKAPTAPAAAGHVASPAASGPQGTVAGVAEAAAVPQRVAVAAAGSPADEAAAGVAAVLGSPFQVGEEVEVMPGDCMGGWYKATVEEVAKASTAEGGWRLLLDMEVMGPSRELKHRKAWMPWVQGRTLRVRPKPQAAPAHQHHEWKVGEEVEVRAQFGWWPAVVRYSDVNTVEVEYVHPPPSIKDKHRKLWPVHRDNVREPTSISLQAQRVLEVAAQYSAAGAALGAACSLPVAVPALASADGGLGYGPVGGIAQGLRIAVRPEQVAHGQQQVQHAQQEAQQPSVPGRGSMAGPAAAVPAVASVASGWAVGQGMPAVPPGSSPRASQALLRPLQPQGKQAQLAQARRQQATHGPGPLPQQAQREQAAHGPRALSQQAHGEQEVAASPRALAAGGELSTPPQLQGVALGRERERRALRQPGPSRLSSQGALELPVLEPAVDERVRRLQALPPLQGSPTLRALLRQAQQQTTLGM